MNSNDLMRSFKATTNLAQSLTKDRVKIQHDLQKISHGIQMPMHFINYSFV